MKPTLTMLLVAAIFASGCLGATREITEPGAATGNVGGAPGLNVTSVFPGDYDFAGPFARPLEQGTLGILAPERVVITSALDGADIEMGLHRPDTSHPVPVLVVASPYFSATGGWIDVTAREHPIFASPWVYLIKDFVPHGYAVVGVAVRGTGGSGGCNDFMGPNEAADLDQAITWLGEQEWSSGAIAMTGMSYDGSTPWLVAAQGNPYLKTIVAQNGVVDHYADQFRNGTFDLAAPGRTGTYYALDLAQETAGPEQIPARAACVDAVMGLAAEVRMGLDGTDPTGYWDARDRRAAVLQNYRGSVFAVHGLQDWNVAPDQYVPFIDELESAGIRVKQMYGQYGHNYPGIVGGSAERQEIAKLHRADFAEVLLHWFDHELKGLDVDTGAPVQVADDTHRWRNELHYPPRDADWTTYHLTTDGPAAAPGPRASLPLGIRTNNMQGSCVGNDPIPQSDPFADFTFPPQDTERLIVGTPRVHLAITPDTTVTTLYATLCEWDADGNRRKLGHTTMNLDYADGTRRRTPHEAGVTIPVKMEIQPMDSVVRPGSELKLRIWIHDGWQSAGRGSYVFPSGGATLELGHDIPSVLVLPTIERGPEVYFDPPRPDA